MNVNHSAEPRHRSENGDGHVGQNLAGQIATLSPFVSRDLFVRFQPTGHSPKLSPETTNMRGQKLLFSCGYSGLLIPVELSPNLVTLSDFVNGTLVSVWQMLLVCIVVVFGHVNMLEAIVYSSFT
jgi:hypothetical protein